MPSRLVSAATIPGSVDTNSVSTPGRRARTSYPPTTSSAVNPSKSRMQSFMTPPCRCRTAGGERRYRLCAGRSRQARSVRDHIAEALAVTRWAGGGVGAKDLAEGRLVDVTDLRRDLVQPQVRRLEEPLGPLHPKAVQVLQRRRPRLVAEPPQQAPRADVQISSQPAHVEGLVEVLSQPPVNRVGKG